ncbi:MAG: VWA domain-containing protein [Vicinamibacterales bacterium]
MSAALAVAVILAADPTAARTAPTNRTVHVSVTDGKGTAVTDLTAADLVVKEGGKEREIVRAEPAAGRLRLALAVEERLVGDGQIRLGMFEFVKRVAKSADVSLITIGLSNRTLVDFTPDANAVLDAINKLTLNPRGDSNLTEGVLEIVNAFSAAKAERPALVVVALSGGQAGGAEPRNVLDRLGESGVTMHSVTLEGGGASAGLGSMADESGREQVLGDGAKQSGGRRHDLTVTAGAQKALLQVADELLAQYAITYALPDGVKPNKRFSISSKRRGVTLRAPSIVPERQ